VSYDHSRPVTAATIVPPTATTHSTNMMQRVIFLEVRAQTTAAARAGAGGKEPPAARGALCLAPLPLRRRAAALALPAQLRRPRPRTAPQTSDSTPGSITVKMPQRAARVANPGYYMLWLLDGDVPCKEASWIWLG
jgi:hypothetical protein